MRGLGAAELNLFDLFAKISLDTSEYDSGVKDVTKSGSSLASKLKSGLASAGKVAAAGIGAVTAAAGAAVGGLLALEQSTEEYRIAMGRLNTAFESAGYSADTAQQAYRAFYGILGDTDTATEASQLLASLADSAEDVSVWTDIAAGVAGTFGDALPIESLIESANETARVGQVTGTLADALNWASISEDDFNSKLEACSSESERNQLIMETLAGQYDEASDAFYRNNEALVASRNAQAQMDEVLSELGQTVSEVKAQLTADFLPTIAQVATAFNGMLSGTEGADEAFATAVQGLVQKAVEQLPAFLNMGVQILSSLASGIVQSIPTLVSVVPQIIAEIGAALAELLPQVLDMGVQLLDQLTSGIESGLPDMVSRIPEIINQFLNYITEQLPVILQKGVEILNSLVNGIINSIPQMVAALPQIISAFLNFIVSNLPAILQAGVSILTNLIAGIANTIPKLATEAGKVVSTITNKIGELPSKALQWGKDLISNFVNGIKNSIGKVTSAVTSVANKVADFIGFSEPEEGPLSNFHTYAPDMMKLFSQGIRDNAHLVQDQLNKSLDFDFGTANVDFASSSLGRSQAGFSGALNGIAASVGQNFTITVQSVLDGKVIGETAYQYSRNKARAYGG